METLRRMQEPQDLGVESQAHRYADDTSMYDVVVESRSASESPCRNAVAVDNLVFVLSSVDNQVLAILQDLLPYWTSIQS